jgi:replicative DNA helicase
VLIKDIASAANIAHHADIIREKSQRRQLISFAIDLQEKAFADSNLADGELMEAAEGDLFKISEQVRAEKSKISHVKEVLKYTLDEIQEAADRPEGEILGSSTSFGSLDEITDGLQEGDLIIVAGRPAMGKTTLAGDLEIAVAKGVTGDDGGVISRPKPVLSINLEMPATQLVKRHISKMSGVPLKKIRTAKGLDENDWVKMSGAAIKPMKDFPLFIVEDTSVTVSDIVAHARRAQRDCYKKYGRGLGLITIDYLQLIVPALGRSHESKANQVGDISRALKVLAMELKVPIVLLSQLNRGLEQRPNKRPMMADVRDSGAIEQDADGMYFVYRDEVYDPDSPDKGFAEIIIAKQRNGPLGTAKLAFNGPCTRFENPVFGFEGDYHG